MQAKQLTPAIGAVVSDIDLCKPLSPVQYSEVSALLVEHHVLFFENQPKSEAFQALMILSEGSVSHFIIDFLAPLMSNLFTTVDQL